MLAANQREENLKTEPVVPLYGGLGEPTAIVSATRHQEHFGENFAITAPDGSVAHSACVGFGMERIALALLRTHGRQDQRMAVGACCARHAARMTELAADPTVSAPISRSRGPVAAPGVLSTPQAAAVRGGVVVCPSLGKEQAETTRWLKLFAERLAARGFAVLRFDYPNTGESAGAQDAPDAAHN